MAFFTRLKERWVWVVVGFVLIGGVVWWYRARASATGPTRYAVATAQTATVVSTVDGTGQISALHTIDLKPQGSGTIVQLNVAPGQLVKAGQTIAVLDERSASVSIQQARASLASAQANYDRVLSGATNSDIALSQISVDSARAQLKNAQDNLETVKKQQATAIANAGRTLYNGNLIAMPTDARVGVSSAPTISGSYSSSEQGSYYIMQGGSSYTVSGLENTGTFQIQNTLPIPLGTRGLYIQFPSNFAAIGETWEIDIPNVQGTTYTSNFNAYQNALQNQTSAIQTAESQVNQAQLSLQQAEQNLAIKQEAAAPADVAAARAQIVNAQASFASAQNQYRNNIVTAPFDGQIASVPVVRGDQASSATTVATLLTPQKIATITLNEIDAAKVTLGEQATLTLDALPDITLTGKVSQIDMIGTVAQGVVNYTVQITLDTDDEKIKPGMSVSASIITDNHPNVLTVPNSAVHTQGTQSYVLTYKKSDVASTDTSGNITLNTSPAQLPVEVGIANDTVTEILSGLQAGDDIITQTISATKTTASTNNSSLRIPGITGGGNTTFRAGGNFGSAAR